MKSRAKRGKSTLNVKGGTNVRDSGMEHRFYHLGEIPNRIDLTSAKKGTTKTAQK
jgi:hypothetical protein